MTNDELEQGVIALEHDRALMGWYASRVNRDLAEIGVAQIGHTRILERIEAKLGSLTQMVGEVLNRLREPDDTDD